MKKPEIKVVRFGAEDVIATSGVMWKNLGGDTKGDSTVSFGGNTFVSHSKYQDSDIRDALKNYYGWSESPIPQNVYFSIEKEGTSHQTLYTLWMDEDSKLFKVPEGYNTTYWYKGLDGGIYWFRNQP